MLNWLRKLFASPIFKQHVTNINSGKSFDEIYNELGAFSYDHEGFVISYEEISQRIKWSDITQLNVYKRDLYTTDRVDMEIVYSDQRITISEELPGWYQFVLKTKEIFPTIPKEWEFTIIQPPFATNYRTIYESK
jgi:hypothetical protein